MKSALDLERAFAELRAEEWTDEFHRERLARELVELRRNRSGASRGLLAAAGLALFGGLAFGAVQLREWIVTTRIGDRDAGSTRVRVDETGARTFTVPVNELDDLDRLRFEFEIAELEAPWVDFDIHIEGGLAHVTAWPRTEAPIDAGEATRAIAGLRERVHADGGALWGVELSHPLLFVSPATRAVVAEERDANDLLFPWQGLFGGRLPEDVAPANTTIEWSGTRWTMLMWPLPSDGEERDRLLLHESFHSVQPELGLWESTSQCSHLDEELGRVWLRLEGRALERALLESPWSESRTEAVLDALRFRAMRRVLHPGSGPKEDGLERLEGAAEDTGLRLGSRTPESRHAAALERVRRLETQAKWMRSFPYSTGPAYGALLDQEGFEWREPFLAGATFGSLAAEAFAWSSETDERLEELARERAASYRFEELAQEEAERALRRREQLVRFRARYLDTSALTLPAVEQRYSFDPHGVSAFEDHGTVYEPVTVRDVWGVLSAPGGALIAVDGTVRLPASTSKGSERPAGDGWSLELAEGWTVFEEEDGAQVLRSAD